ncbi:hypothetical protein CCACVL1_02236, partial [Corchorus capsularis]
EVEGVERPVYYLSRCLHGSELNYSPIEKHCLSLVFATQKLQHYLLAHKVTVVTKSDPIRYILSRPILAGRAAKWLLLLGQFDLSVAQPKAIKSQALSDLLAYFPIQSEEAVTLDSMLGDVEGESVRCEHSPRSSNRYVDALATLASKIHIPGQKEEISLLVQRWSVPGPLAGMTEYYLGEVSKDADWRTPIIEQLRERKSSNLRFLKSYTIIQGALYYRGPNGILARCISPEKAKERLRTSHKQWCGMEGPPLYRRMQRDGYYWRTMSSDCADAQYACPRCSEPPDVNDCHFVGSVGYWRRPYIEYLQNGVLPTNHQDARNLKRK